MSDLKVFGNIEFVRSQRASRISVKILGDGLKISLPPRSTESEATRWVLDNKELILKKQHKARTRRKNNTLITEENELTTLTFDVKVKKVDRKDVFFSMKNSLLTIEYPEDADIRSGKLQKICWNGIRYFLKKEAARMLPERLETLAKEFNFKYKDLKIQSGKTRWGSCSNKGSINLTLYLMMLPQHLVDYVILHELCHTREMNHSDKFWKLMDDVTEGKTHKLRAEMKKYGMPE
jgi:predicted metal-dependent hydrolase